MDSEVVVVAHLTQLAWETTSMRITDNIVASLDSSSIMKCQVSLGWMHETRCWRAQGIGVTDAIFVRWPG